MQRISVVGTSGSGKTTFARQLADKSGLLHVELDAIHWLPNWEELPRDEFRRRVEAALSGNSWTVDGNYSKVRDIVWGRADTVVWLDYPLHIVLWRVFWRIIRRAVTRENLWGTGNRETLFRHFFTRDSLLWWVLKTYRRRKREYPALLALPEYAHLRLVRLRSPKEADRWLAALSVNDTD